MTDLSPTARFWLDIVLARLGMPEWKRQECIAGAPVVIGEVKIVFLEPSSGEKGYVVARAVVGDVPPPGQCEALYQLALEVQAMLCGPHTPVLGLDWPARALVVSCSLEIQSLNADDAAAILCSIQQMALQWREAIAGMDTAPASNAPRAVGQR